MKNPAKNSLCSLSLVVAAFAFALTAGNSFASGAKKEILIEFHQPTTCAQALKQLKNADLLLSCFREDAVKFFIAHPKDSVRVSDLMKQVRRLKTVKKVSLP